MKAMKLVMMGTMLILMDVLIAFKILLFHVTNHKFKQLFVVII